MVGEGGQVSTWEDEWSAGVSSLAQMVPSGQPAGKSFRARAGRFAVAPATFTCPAEHWQHPRHLLCLFPSHQLAQRP